MNGRRLGHVGLDGDGRAALGCDRGNHAVGSLLAGGVVDRHARPFVRQMPGDGGTDAVDAPVTTVTFPVSR
jgi:hypothetical protein